MEKILNDALIPLVNEGRLSMNRIRGLIYIRDFIDRASTKEYISGRLVAELEEACGEVPDIITWGDYFQTELALCFRDFSDEAFGRTLDSVRFDIMSCVEIFPGKSEDFFAWIDSRYYAAADPDHELTAEDAEYVQLKIMKDYYVHMGLADNFTPAEKSWYSSYDEAAAV